MKFLADYSAPEQAALRTEICPEASDDQINYFLRVCEARNVEPFSGLLYMQRRQSKGKWKCSVQPTVDGSRASAARTDQYAGSDEPEFDSEDAEHPKWCKVTVYRMQRGMRCAYTAKCRWREFVPQAPNDFQWRGKPYHMLAKVTEVQALRKAFPESVSAAGEDDHEDIAETAPVVTPERAGLAVQWQKAVQAFAPFKKSEADMLAHLKIAKKEDATEDHMESLQVWYLELSKDE